MERSSKSTFVDSIDDEAKLQIVQWASRLDSFTLDFGVKLHPPECMFAADGASFPLMHRCSCVDEYLLRAFLSAWKGYLGIHFVLVMSDHNDTSRRKREERRRRRNSLST